MKILEIMKNLAVVIGVFAAGWTACVEIKVSRMQDKNTELERTISSLKSNIENIERNIKSSPQYLEAQRQLDLSKIKVDDQKNYIARLEDRIDQYSDALNASLSENNLVEKIDELRSEKKKIDEKLRCEVDQCYSISADTKEVNQNVVDAYRQQSADIQEQINLLIEQLDNKT